MIDFALGAIAASIIWYICIHLSGAQTSTLEGIIAQITAEVRTIMSQVSDEIIALIDTKITAAVAKAVADTQAADSALVDAAKQDVADIKTHIESLPG